MFLVNLLTYFILGSVILSTSVGFLVKNIDFFVDQFARHHTVKFYGSRSGNADVIVRRGDYLEFGIELYSSSLIRHIEALFSFSKYLHGLKNVNIYKNWSLHCDDHNDSLPEVLYSYLFFLYFQTDTTHDKLDIRLSPSVEEYGWNMKQNFDEHNKRQINVKIYIPPDAPVGVWKLSVYLISKRGRKIQELDAPNKVIVLFNPWSREDATYFPEEEKLDEYLMNERGYTYSYDFVRPHATPWIFGQFRAKVLNAILFVLDKSSLKAAERGDIVRVTRELTALMNDGGFSDPGVLRGKWSEPYNTIGGRPATKPWEWAGSPPIFLQYLETGKPVGYGQCWVFAGILTTAYRALGIASRPVSNLVSAHSDDRDLTIDIRLDEKGKVVEQEMIWNFHVWNQAWFKRNDLNDSYSGWQELDATPQEMNDHRYQTGPASSIGIRNSELRLRYQSDFVYEEANADEVVWSHDNQILSINRHKIGKALLTKAYGGEGAEDITDMYKPPENTEEERESYRAAAKSLGVNPPSLRSHLGRAGTKEIIIEIKPPTKLLIGSLVSLNVSLKNPSMSEKVLEVKIKAKAMYYNGKEAETLQSKVLKITLAGHKLLTIPFKIKPEEYIGKLKDKYTIRVEVFARNQHDVAFKEHLFSLQTPKLIITAPKSVNINETFIVNVQITNPLKQKLTDCHVVVEGTRIQRTITKINDISSLSIKTAPIELRTLYARNETIVVSFYSGDLLKMQSSTHFLVNGMESYQFANYEMDSKPPSGPESLEANFNKITLKNFKCCRLTRITLKTIYKW